MNTTTNSFGSSQANSRGFNPIPSNRGFHSSSEPQVEKHPYALSMPDDFGSSSNQSNTTKMQSPTSRANTSSSELPVEKHPYALSSMPDDFGERFHSSSNHQQQSSATSKMKANNANGFIHPSSIGNISNDPPDIQHQSSQIPNVSQSMPPSSNNIPDGAELSASRMGDGQ